MGYLSASHIYRLYVDYLGWSLDYTGPQMVLTLKLTAFAWSYYDGTRPKEELTKELYEKRIMQMPGLIEYFGWVYFFPSFLAGPAIELKHYTTFMEGKLFDEKYYKGEGGSRLLATLKVLGITVCCGALTVVAGLFPPSYILTEAFRAEPIWLKFVRVYLHSGPSRGKYYVAWFLAEASCVSCGIAYNPANPSGWDKLRNCYPLSVEFGTNFREIINNWNIATSNWLRNYVYMRTTKDGKPTFYSTLLTYTVSAFWHGFYPGYYLFFVGGAIGTEVSKHGRRIFRRFFVTADDKPIYPRKFFYDVFTTIASQWTLCYLAFAFHLLSLEKALEAWATLNYIPLIIMLALLVIFPLIPVKAARTPNRE
jgi:lysophospholipid acyltransferase